VAEPCRLLRRGLLLLLGPLGSREHDIDVVLLTSRNPLSPSEMAVRFHGIGAGCIVGEGSEVTVLLSILDVPVLDASVLLIMHA